MEGCKNICIRVEGWWRVGGGLPRENVQTLHQPSNLFIVLLFLKYIFFHLLRKKRWRVVSNCWHTEKKFLFFLKNSQKFKTNPTPLHPFLESNTINEKTKKYKSISHHSTLHPNPPPTLHQPSTFLKSNKLYSFSSIFSASECHL